MSSDLDQICSVLDRLTLDALTLIEDQIQAKLNVENAMSSGELCLAKSRYILGHNSVSAIQLPSEDSQDIEPQTIVNSNDDSGELGEAVRSLEIVKNESQVDPIKWFGYLVPQDLHRAQVSFKQTLQWIINAINVQTKLAETCSKMWQLKELKINIMTTKSV